jgi:hypothetical protein
VSKKKGPEAFLYGAIPAAPIIFCKNEDAAILIQAAMHTHLTHEPPVVVLEEWPEEVEHNAVVLTPLDVLGTTEKPSFGIDTVAELEPPTQKVLNAAIRLAITGKQVSIRNLSTAVHGDDKISSKRQISHQLARLEEAGLIRRVEERGPYKLLFGRWRYDAAAAKAAGIEITEYDDYGMKVPKDKKR